MKNILGMLLTAFALSGSINAQVSLYLEEREMDFPDGFITAWTFPLAGTMEESLDHLKDYCKDRTDLKMKKGGDNMLIAEKVSVPTLAAKRGDLIGHTYMTDQEEVMCIAFRLGYDISLNSKDWPSEMESLRNYTKDFMSFHYEETYNELIENLEKEIKVLEKDRDQLDRKIENGNDKIANIGKKIGKETDTEKINEYEQDINTLEADVRALMDQLPGLRSQITTLKQLVEEHKAEAHSYQATILSF